MPKGKGYPAGHKKASPGRKKTTHRQKVRTGRKRK